MWTSPLRALAAGVVLVAAVVLAGAQPATSGPPPVGSSFYTVRPDPRLCPSPRCGGYWVALANRAQTRCSDGVLRPRCYVARIVGEDRHPLESGVPSDALVRADLEPWSFEGFGELGVLVVAAVWESAGQEIAGSVYRVKDLGVRCIRAPCFSLRAARLNTSLRTTLSGLELRLAFLTADQGARAEVALTTTNGLFASGRIVQTTGGGRVLRAWRVYLRVALPRG